jgi:metallo-beta-lactamase class B
MKRVLQALCGLVVALLAVAAVAWFYPPLVTWLYITVLGLNHPAPPVRIADNLYYVGASDLSSFLVTGSQGHVLIDSGAAQTEPLVIANIRSAGFDPKGVKIILNSHGHFDHAGGMAALKDATGAALYASPEEAKLIEAGGRGDFQYGDHIAYERAKVDRVLADGEVVHLGDIALTAHFTPGHTKGCTSWSMRVTVDGIPRDLLLVCFFSVPGDVKNYPAYRQIVEDLRETFMRLETLPCEVFIGPHGQGFDLATKRRSERRDAFVDPAGCAAFIQRQKRRFEAQVGEGR